MSYYLLNKFSTISSSDDYLVSLKTNINGIKRKAQTFSKKVTTKGNMAALCMIMGLLFDQYHLKY